MRTLAGIVLCFGLTLVAAVIGSIASTSAPQLYAELEQPSWAPPSWVFGPVWTALYLMMGLAAFLVWRVRGWSGVLTLFAIHLFFNALWSWLFFRWRLGGLAFADIVVLWLMIGVLVIGFGRTHRVAGALLVPYWAWVTYAAALNLDLWRRNPSILAVVAG